jgi:hypothetical protein
LLPEENAEMLPLMKNEAIIAFLDGLVCWQNVFFELETLLFGGECAHN